MPDAKMIGIIERADSCIKMVYRESSFKAYFDILSFVIHASLRSATH